MVAKDWFKTWFDSPYYHTLYQHRDFSEAENFLKELLDFLNVQPQQKALDLACGKGRHAIQMEKYGLDVLALDLSEQSILAAKASENEHLKFGVHDMRNPLPSRSFDYIFNLFTSFGYFEENKENEQVLSNIYSALNSGGTFVIDFFNADKIITRLVAREEKTLDGITFNITREYTGTHIVKTINFTDNNEMFTFQEKVQTFAKDELIALLENAGFTVEHTFGDYNLNNFSPQDSPRTILIAKK